MSYLIGIFIFLAFSAPRLTLLFLAIFSHFLQETYPSLLWPLLGFFFLPFTTLAYAAACHWSSSVTGLYLMMVVLAVLLDLATLGGTGYRQRLYFLRRHY